MELLYVKGKCREKNTPTLETVSQHPTNSISTCLEKVDLNPEATVDGFFLYMLYANGSCSGMLEGMIPTYILGESGYGEMAIRKVLTFSIIPASARAV